MKKRIVALLLVLVLAIGVLAACGGSKTPETKAPETQATEAPADKTEAPATEAPATEAPADQKFHIGVLIFDYSNDYINYVRKGLEAAADAAGVTYQDANAENNQPTMNDQMDQIYAKGVDGFCIAPVESGAAAALIDKVKADNVPIAFVNKQPTPEVLNSYDNCYFVGCATKLPGVQEFQMIEEDWKKDPTMDKNGDGKIQYVVIKGENGHENSEQRIIGMNEVIEASDLEWDQLDLQVCGWNTAKAKDQMDAWISRYGDQIEVVASQNDAMALGAIEALRGAGMVLPVYGINCLQSALEAMEKGDLRGSVKTDMLLEGATTFQVLYNMLRGVDKMTDVTAEYEEDTKCFRVPTVPVRLENIDEGWEMYK